VGAVPALRISLWIVIALVTGCAHGKGKIQPRTLVIHTTAKVNQGRHFYLLVRSVNEGEFLSDGYQKIAGMVLPASKDPTVLAVAVVWPADTQKIVVKLPDDGSFAIYALFTSPGDPWKVLLPAPLRRDYEFDLDDGHIVATPRPGEAKTAARSP
jgi:hypothetical protein